MINYLNISLININIIIRNIEGNILNKLNDKNLLNKINNSITKGFYNLIEYKLGYRGSFKKKYIMNHNGGKYYSTFFW